MKIYRFKYTFFLIVVFLLTLVGFTEWFVLSVKFKPNMIEGNDYDILDYTRLFLVSFHYSLLFTFLSFIIVLGLFLIYKRKIEPIIVRNIYCSLIYLLSLIMLIEIIFKNDYTSRLNGICNSPNFHGNVGSDGSFWSKIGEYIDNILDHIK